MDIIHVHGEYKGSPPADDRIKMVELPAVAWDRPLIIFYMATDLKVCSLEGTPSRS